MLLVSACGGGGDPWDLEERSAEENAFVQARGGGLPLHLADDQQQGLDGAPVEKANKQDDFQRAPRRDDELNVGFAARLRFTIPFGAADHSYSSYYPYYYVDHYLSWADFFNPGWGFEMEADIYLNNAGSRRTPGFYYGIAVLFQVDQYYGSNVHDGHGDTLSVGDMTTGSIQVGGKVVQTLSNNFFYGGMIALGAVHYSEVDGTFSGPLFAQFRDRIFRDTWTFASSFRADGGYRIGALAIVAGLGFRIMAPPSEGTHLSLNSGAFWTFDMDLGLELGF
jgi:hypothetical protein